MGTPEDIPEDRYPSYPCDCGGNITQNLETEDWECDQCNFSMEGLPKLVETEE